MDDSTSYDAIVIGAGFAGATAARDLGKQGKSVLVLEARDRIGGRTWTKPFADTDKAIEMGGTWIVPEVQTAVGAELERYDIGVVYSPEPEEFVWDLDGEIVKGFPIPMEEMRGFETALYELKRNAERIDFGEPLADDLAELDVAPTEFLDGLDGVGPKTRDFIACWGDLFGGGRAEEFSFLHMLWFIAGLHDSPWATFAAVAEKVDGGTKRLIEAIMGDSGADLRLETPVASVTQDDDGVTVTTAAGESFRAPAAIVATPSNCWGDIEFTPALSPEKQLFTDEKHLSRVHKVWALIEDMPDTFAMGRRPEAFSALIADAKVEDGALHVCFKIEGDGIDFTDLEAVQEQVRRYQPNARVVKVDHHDWNADPYAKGAMLGHRKGRAFELMDALQKGEGRVSFAGGDVAATWNGWIDGAIESGATAAARTERILAEGAAVS